MDIFANFDALKTSKKYFNQFSIDSMEIANGFLKELRATFITGGFYKLSHKDVVAIAKNARERAKISKVLVQAF